MMREDGRELDLVGMRKSSRLELLKTHAGPLIVLTSSSPRCSDRSSRSPGYRRKTSSANSTRRWAWRRDRLSCGALMLMNP